MSDNGSDADRVRLRRLERLRAAQAEESANQPASSSSSQSAASSSSAAAATVKSPVQRSPLTSSPAIGVAASSAPVKKVPSSISTPVSKPSTPVPRPSSASTSHVKSSPASTPKPPASSSSSSAPAPNLNIPFPQWLSGTISRVLQVTLSQSRAESSNWSVTYLYTLHDELVEEAGGNAEAEGSLRFDEDNLERAIVARLSLDPAQMIDDEEAEKNPVALTVLAGLPAELTNLEYLVGCWRRWHTERTRFGNPKQVDAETSKRIQALEFIKQKILEGIGLQLQEPELFPQPSGKVLGGDELLPSLLQLSSIPTSPALSLDERQVITLLTELATAYTSTGSPEELVDIIGLPVVQKVIDKLGAKSSSIQAMLAAINGAGAAPSGAMDLAGSDWRAVVRVINDLTEVKSIGAMFTEMPNWSPAEATPNTFEIEALLGPAMRLGCFFDAFPSVAKAYFATPSALSREAAEASSNALRSSLGSLQGLLFSAFNNIVRSGPTHREAVLAFFAHIIKLNMKRDGMQVDPRTVSTDAFMINAFSILMDFSSPFMDANYSKIDKIDAEYFRKTSRLDISDVTKINASGEDAKEYYHNYIVPDGTSPPNFISEIFFMATSFMHYGLYPAFNKHEQLYRQLRYMREDLAEAEANRQFDGTPQEAAYRQQVERVKANTESFHSRVFAAEVQLLDPGFIAKTSNFCSFVMSWLVRLVDPKGKHPVQEISLSNLPEETPLAFRMLPEYFIEDVTEFYHFISRYAPQTMIDMQKDQLLVFIIVFLCTPYVKNPFLKGKFVEILYRNTRSWGPRFPRGTLGDTLNYHPLALKGLLPALMRIYCEIEFTGQHNQFYEKFEVRHQIAKILKLIWETKEHREAFKAETSKEDFVRFVNFLLNDTTFLLDESLSKLKTIHDLQLEMADKATWDAQTDEERKDKEKLFKSAEGQATSFLIYTYEVLHLLKTLTVEAPDPFLRSEIVDRLAASLDFNLNVLAGPRCQELRVQDKEKYKFKPRELLGDIMQIIINLANKDRYITATAKDGRSYSKTLFDNAMRIAGRTGLKSEQQLQLLRRMVTEIEALKAQEEEEEEMEETPDEYLDPLTADIMSDPVILPSSKTVIDYSTIKQHLLTVQQDPFNRSPLTIDQVQRDDKLREEIEAFRAQRRQERLNRLQAARHAEEPKEDETMQTEPAQEEDSKMEE